MLNVLGCLAYDVVLWTAFSLAGLTCSTPQGVYTFGQKIPESSSFKFIVLAIKTLFVLAVPSRVPLHCMLIV